MRRVLMIVGGALIVSGVAMGASETWSNVPMIDTGCALKVKDAPDTHTRACALQCSKGGFGLIAADGTYLKFDEDGNAKAVAALKASKATDHLPCDGHRRSTGRHNQGGDASPAVMRIE